MAMIKKRKTTKKKNKKQRNVVEVGVYNVVIVILNDGNVDVNDDVNVVMVEFVISWDVELWIGDAKRGYFCKRCLEFILISKQYCGDGVVRERIVLLDRLEVVHSVMFLVSIFFSDFLNIVYTV